MDKWILASRELPEVGQDKLVYSMIFKGYAVARLEGVSVVPRWINSTNGLEFPPNSITHWTELLAAPLAQIEPQTVAAYEGYSNN